jgi:hypothetical protein
VGPFLIVAGILGIIASALFFLNAPMLAAGTLISAFTTSILLIGAGAIVDRLGAISRHSKVTADYFRRLDERDRRDAEFDD